jgi:hypothetical protein
LPAGATSVGTWGMNSHSNKPGYAPPCSKGPGAKKYIITIYALSEQPKIDNTYPIKINQLLAAINGHVLDSAILTVSFTLLAMERKGRNITATDAANVFLRNFLRACIALKLWVNEKK